jgi:hypothetical protein
MLVQGSRSGEGGRRRRSWEKEGAGVEKEGEGGRSWEKEGEGGRREKGEGKEGEK